MSTNAENAENAELELVDEVLIFVFRLSEGNPGALRVCREVISRFSENVDAALVILQTLMAMKIYGPAIWEIYKDVCECDIDRFNYVVMSRYAESLRR